MKMPSLSSSTPLFVNDVTEVHISQCELFEGSFLITILSYEKILVLINNLIHRKAIGSIVISQCLLATTLVYLLCLATTESRLRAVELSWVADKSCHVKHTYVQTQLNTTKPLYMLSIAENSAHRFEMIESNWVIGVFISLDRRHSTQQLSWAVTQCERGLMHAVKTNWINHLFDKCQVCTRVRMDVRLTMNEKDWK